MMRQRGAVIAVFSGKATRDTLLVSDNPVPQNFDGTLDFHEHAKFAGGSATNAAITFSLLGQKTDNGARAILYTATGGADDAFYDDFTQAGVTVRQCRPADDFRMPHNYIFAAEGERLKGRDKTNKSQKYPESSIVIPEILKDDSDIDIGRANIHMMGTSYAALSLQLAEKSLERGVHIMMDAGSMNGRTEELIYTANTIVASHELLKNATPKETLNYLRGLNKHAFNIAVTCGVNPSLILNPDNSVTEVPVPKLGKAIDTNAAGDCHKGALAYAMTISKFKDFKWAMAEANRVASNTVLYLGPREGIKRMEQVPEYAAPVPV